MEPFWIIWIIFGILGIASTFFAYCAAKRRREAMAAQAGQLGFAYERSKPELVRQFAMLGDPFTRGYGRRADNVLTGTWNGRPKWRSTTRTRPAPAERTRAHTPTISGSSASTQG